MDVKDNSDNGIKNDGRNEKLLDSELEKRNEVIKKLRERMNNLKRVHDQTKEKNQEILDRIHGMDIPENPNLEESFEEEGDPNRPLLENDSFSDMNKIFDEMRDFLDDQERQAVIEKDLSKLEDSRMKLYSKILDKLEDDGEEARRKLGDISEEKGKIRGEILVFKKRNAILTFIIVMIIFFIMVLL